MAATWSSRTRLQHLVTTLKSGPMAFEPWTSENVPLSYSCTRCWSRVTPSSGHSAVVLGSCVIRRQLSVWCDPRMRPSIYRCAVAHHQPHRCKRQSPCPPSTGVWQGSARKTFSSWPYRDRRRTTLDLRSMIDDRQYSRGWWGFAKREQLNLFN